jgi:hypothetical protein
MASNWISVKKRLPTEDDVKRNSGQDLFLVTAIFRAKGYMQKTVYAAHFNINTNSWWVCDEDIVTHWRYLPSPAIVELDECEE